MEKYLLLIAFFITITSCQQQPAAETAETAETFETAETVATPEEEAVSTVVEEEENIEEEEKIRPLANILLGNIDHQYAIEVELYPTNDNSPKEDCVPVEGRYHYATQNKFMKIEGEWCQKDKSLTFNRIKNGEAVEFFEGQVEGNLAEVQGTWKKGDKTLDFELKNVTTLPEYLLFVEALKEILRENPIVSVEEVGLDEKGFYLVKPELGKYNFSATDLFCRDYYESTAVNVDIEIKVYFKKSLLTDNYIVISSSTIDIEDFPEGKLKDAEPVYSKEVTHAVYLYLNKQAVDVFVSSEEEATTAIYAILKDNKLTLIDKTTGKEEVLE